MGEKRRNAENIDFMKEAALKDFVLRIGESKMVYKSCNGSIIRVTIKTNHSTGTYEFQQK
jgi:hypothetical protein